MLKTQSGKRQREKMKNQRATTRSQWAGPEGHIREVVEEPGHDFRMKGAIGKGSLLETVFHVREAGYEVEKRIIDSRAPLVRTTTTTSSDSYYQELIPIPVRAAWSVKMKPDEVQAYEDDEFEKYLQKIYDAYPPYRLNHFEHNLHVWKQLWRVVEISDILVMVADSRHPLFHVPPSLYDYIVNVCKKPMICLLNKIDFISSKNLNAWIEDFKTRFPLLTVVPFSSFPHEKTITNPDADEKQDKKRKAIQHEKNKVGKKDAPKAYGIENLLRVLEEVHKQKTEGEKKLKAEQQAAEAAAQALDPNWRPQRVKNKKAAFAKAREQQEALQLDAVKSVEIMQNLKTMALETDIEKAVERMQENKTDDSQLYSNSPAGASPAVKPAEATTSEVAPLVDEAAHDDDDTESIAPKPTDNIAGPSDVGGTKSASKITVGMIGHPNAGKSSLINALFGKAVVSVSETPGHTKHLQTLALNDTIEICDCPGLVFPAVDMPRPLQVLCGIFPISQLREPYSSVQYLASRIELEKIYGLVPPSVQGILESAGIDTSRASAQANKESAASKAGVKKLSQKQAKQVDFDEAEDGVDLFAELQIQEAAQKAKEYVWTAWDICEQYAKMRNYSIKGSKGLYDSQRAANDILHDALSGVVLLTFTPPIRNTPLGGPSAATTAAPAAAAAEPKPASAQ